MTQAFQDMMISPETLGALAEMGVTEPTPIQAEATPHLLAGRDVVGQASTGSGKTLAFSIPLVERSDRSLKQVQALILVPTRELAFQVGSVVEALGKPHGLRCAFLYGGRDVSDQQALLASGPQIVIGTPGRVLDLLYRGNLRLSSVTYLVIDEADEMLDEGFGPDVEQILDCVMQKMQIALFSATIPDWVESIVAHRLHEPVTVRIDTKEQPVDSVEHTVIDVSENRKFDALRSLLDAAIGSAVVFCRTKDRVERLARELQSVGYELVSLRGNMTQPERERVMRAFRTGHPPILVATNVAARGLDITHISRVINYDLPDSVELLTHRLGRTGRMGRAGEAMTLVTPRENKRWLAMQSRLGAHVTRVDWVDGNAGASEHSARPAVSAPIRSDAPRRNSGPRPSGARLVDRGPRRVGTGPRRSLAPTNGSPRSQSRTLVSAGSGHTGPCEGCGAEVTVPWTPTPTRPAYCRDCRELVSAAAV